MEWTEERRKKQSELLKSKYASGEFKGMTGKKQSKKWYKAIRKANIGHTRWKHPNCVKNQIKKGKPLSIETQFKKGLIPWNKGKPLSLKIRTKISKNRKGKAVGKNNPKWKGGISPINQKERSSFKYKLWREFVFKRDDFTCQECGQWGGKLIAHHLKQWSKYPKLRFKTDNGITNCNDCHDHIEQKLRLFDGPAYYSGGYF